MLELRKFELRSWGEPIPSIARSDIGLFLADPRRHYRRSLNCVRLFWRSELNDWNCSSQHCVFQTLMELTRNCRGQSASQTRSARLSLIILRDLAPLLSRGLTLIVACPCCAMPLVTDFRHYFKMTLSIASPSHLFSMYPSVRSVKS
jgi:hypothetical protein